MNKTKPRDQQIKGREMVSVSLYEDGTYDVEDINPEYATVRLYGSKNGKHCDVYYCPKASWKKYLLKLLSTKDIDKKIKELEKQKKKIEKLREKITKEIENEQTEKA